MLSTPLPLEEPHVPRKPLSDRGTQTSLRLPRELYDRLAQAAGDRGIGEEIRRRLEVSFAGTAPLAEDQKTRRLLRCIAAAATAVPWVGPVSQMMGTGGASRAWHADPDAFEALARAIPALIEQIAPRPKGEIAENVVKPVAGIMLWAGLAAGEQEPPPIPPQSADERR